MLMVVMVMMLQYCRMGRAQTGSWPWVLGMCLVVDCGAIWWPWTKRGRVAELGLGRSGWGVEGCMDRLTVFRGIHNKLKQSKKHSSDSRSARGRARRTQKLKEQQLKLRSTAGTREQAPKPPANQVRGGHECPKPCKAMGTLEKRHP